jgi:hypothetical protein
MSTAAYGIEAIWEGQQRLLDGFDKLTTVIGRTVAGTFSSPKLPILSVQQIYPRPIQPWIAIKKGYWHHHYQHPQVHQSGHSFFHQQRTT